MITSLLSFSLRCLALSIGMLTSGVVARAQSVAAGAGHSLFVCADGSVLAVGSNTVGQLGDGTTNPRGLPAIVPGVSGVKAVAAADESSLFLKTDGTVWGVGGNTSGKLGIGNRNNQATAVRVGTLTDVAAIATSEGHALFLKTDGTVWGCGSNGGGQLGSTTASPYVTSPIPIPGLTDVVAIAAGYIHSLFLKSDGTVWGCGQSVDGELGMGSFVTQRTPVRIPGLNGIRAIAASKEYRAHSLFLQSNGTVLACGSNYYGGLGAGTPGPTVQVNIPTPVTGLTNVRAIAAGRFHSLFVKADGSAWACGYNGTGQLGNGTTTNAPTPVAVAASGFASLAVGNDFSFFLRADGTVWGSGSGGLGNLGNGGTTNVSTPVRATLVCAVALAVRPGAAAMSIYPVPAVGSLHLRTGTTETVVVQFIDSRGQPSQTLAVHGPETELPVAGMPAGIYLVRIVSRSGVQTQKIVLN